MTDYGHPISFGIFLDPSASDPGRTLEVAQIIDAAGFDLIGIQDHPYQARHMDAMALTSYLLGKTEQVHIFPDVANLPLRPPLMLAKEAATLHLLSGGRFHLGLGAGAFWDAIGAMDGPVRAPGEAVQATQEAIDLIRAFWTQPSLRMTGEFYGAQGLRPGPKPKRDPGIWLGAIGPRMLRLTGERTDGWVPSMAYVPPVQALVSQGMIDEAAIANDRDPAAIRRIYNVSGEISPVLEAGIDPADTQIIGPIQHWIETLSRLATDFGFDTFVLGITPTAPLLQMVMEEIAPAVRERVQAIRVQRG
ncbi:MAG TPA: LLM class flavin-dependent oxidoreductase [Thermomicrobiales bacterium]|nr:LLM class flavin-dependent oxidoreductase [Thermomicrobiales bacterium]